MSKARVGIVLPTYNRSDLLPTAINSVLAQEFEDWELIVVDDNSTDNTSKVVNAYMQRDPRIRYVINDRYGHSCAGARKRGLDEITHEFVAFIDSDDRWPSYHLRELVALLDLNADVDWVFGDIRRIDSHGRVLVKSKLLQEWPTRTRFPTEERKGLFVLESNRLTENALECDLKATFQPSLLRSTIFETIEYHEVPLCDDQLFRLQAAASGIRFAYLFSNHLDYLVHENNISGARATVSFQHTLKTNQEVEWHWRRDVPTFVPMNSERRALVRKRLAEHLVWMLGNNVHRAAGQRLRAVTCILRGIVLRPLQWRYWKTLFGTLFGRVGIPSERRARRNALS